MIQDPLQYTTEIEYKTPYPYKSIPKTEQLKNPARQARNEIMRKNNWTGKQYRKHLKKNIVTEYILVCNVCGNESGGYKGDSCPCGEGVLYLKKVKEKNHD